MAAIRENFGDLLEPGLRRVWNQAIDYRYQKAMRYIVLKQATPTNKNYEKTSEMSGLGAVTEFTGTVIYDEAVQGYDTTTYFPQYARGIQIERALFDDDLYGQIARLPKALARAMDIAQEREAAKLFNDGFTTEATGTRDAAELFASDHPSTDTSVANQSNEGTAALTAVAIEAGAVLMMEVQDLKGIAIGIEPNTIIVPLNLRQKALEATASAGKPDTSLNNINTLMGNYRVIVWPNYLTDANNWFIVDYDLMREHALFMERVKAEFNQDVDLNTYVKRFSVYGRWGIHCDDWRWGRGYLVS